MRNDFLGYELKNIVSVLEKLILFKYYSANDY